MKNRRLALQAGLLASAVLLAGCSGSGGSGDAGDTIRIGEFASLTGKEATFGTSSHRGTLLAIKEINAAGGVLGKQLELVYEDNRSLQGESATIAKKLITRDRVVALLGEVASGRSLEVGPIAQQYKVPMITPSSTNPQVTRTGDYVFRVCFTDPFQGRLLANFARNTLKAQKLAILSDVSQAYSVGLAQYFREPWLAGGGTIVADEKFNGGEKDFRAQLTTIKAANPDAILVPGYYTDVGLIVAQARQLGINVPLFGGDGWEAPELIEIAGARALEGTYYSTHFSPESTDPRVQQFVAAYKAEYGGQVPDAMAALGYDSVQVLVDAIRRAGTTEAAALRDAIAATRDFPGVTGMTTLDANRDASKPAVIITVKDGRFQYLETVSP
jgi:branched-chain amino acid transport system substrate-binding protein